MFDVPGTELDVITVKQFTKFALDPRVTIMDIIAYLRTHSHEIHGVNVWFRYWDLTSVEYLDPVIGNFRVAFDLEYLLTKSADMQIIIEAHINASRFTGIIRESHERLELWDSIVQGSDSWRELALSPRDAKRPRYKWRILAPPNTSDPNDFSSCPVDPWIDMKRWDNRIPRAYSDDDFTLTIPPPADGKFTYLIGMQEIPL
jgi:hypothetical protein